MVGTVVGQCCTIGCDRGAGFANHHRTTNKRQVVVGVRAAGSRRVSACVFLSARGGNAGQHRGPLATHQAGGAKAAGGLVGTVVGQVRTVGGDCGAGFGHGIGAVFVREQVVARQAGAHHCAAWGGCERAHLRYRAGCDTGATCHLGHIGHPFTVHERSVGKAGVASQVGIGAGAVVGGGACFARHCDGFAVNIRAGGTRRTGQHVVAGQPARAVGQAVACGGHGFARQRIGVVKGCRAREQGHTLIDHTRGYCAPVTDDDACVAIKGFAGGSQAAYRQRFRANGSYRSGDGCGQDIVRQNGCAIRLVVTACQRHADELSGADVCVVVGATGFNHRSAVRAHPAGQYVIGAA